MRDQRRDHDVDADTGQGRAGQALGFSRLHEQEQGHREVGDRHPGDQRFVPCLGLELRDRTEDQQRQQPCLKHPVQGEQVEFAPLIILCGLGGGGGKAQTVIPCWGSAEYRRPGVFQCHRIAYDHGLRRSPGWLRLRASATIAACPQLAGTIRRRGPRTFAGAARLPRMEPT